MIPQRPASLDAPGAPIYLDYNATTPIDPRCAEAMAPYIHETFGNPNSGHVYGQVASEGVARARQQIADFLGCSPTEVLFTSGGTESNNYAIKGTAWARRDRGRHMVTTAMEHPATLSPMQWLERDGGETTIVDVDKHSMVDPEAIRSALRDDTILVSVMHANNEVGTLQPIAEIADICHERGVLLHVDAAQSAGKVPVRLDELGVDMISVASHKMYGPKGMGVLVVREGVELENLMHGANQERGHRGGTENVILAVGMGAAAEAAAENFEEHAAHLAELRDRLTQKLLAADKSAVVHGHPDIRLPNTLSIGFPGLIAAEIMTAAPGIACSAGAACHDGRTKISAVLAAMGVPLKVAAGTLRLSVGRFTRDEEIDQAAALMTTAIAGLR
jgi:cysteine desulfurase